MKLRPNDGGRKELEARVEALETTVASLEERVAEGQALHQRLAEVIDVVTELIVPLAARDEESAALARRYVDELGS